MKDIKSKTSTTSAITDEHTTRALKNIWTDLLKEREIDPEALNALIVKWANARTKKLGIISSSSYVSNFKKRLVDNSFTWAVFSRGLDILNIDGALGNMSLTLTCNTVPEGEVDRKVPSI